MQTALFDHSTVRNASTPEAVNTAIEETFAAYQHGEAIMPPKSYVDLPAYNGDFRSMPAYVQGTDWDAAGVKWVNVHPDNPVQSPLPTVMGIMIYSDPSTGLPLAIMDGTELTRLRTGAAAAVATDYLAPEDATSLGIIGAGAQSYTQLSAIAALRPIETVVVSDIDDSAIAAFRDRFEDRFDVTRGSIADAGHCDILSTVTPVESPIVSPDDIGSATHINAMGADATGKQELHTDVLRSATVVIDDFEQCTHSGEINVPWNSGALTESDLYGTIGEIVVGNRPGRDAIDGISIFDSTGLAIQDVAAAHVVYESASDRPEYDIIGLDSASAEMNSRP